MDCNGDDMARSDLHIDDSKQEFYAPIKKMHGLFGCGIAPNGMLVTKSSRGHIYGVGTLPQHCIIAL
jgi:hypothetical protein